MKSNDVDFKIRLNDAGRESLLLWINNVAPSKAPKHVQKALSWLYKDFDAAQVAVGMMFHLRTVDCKTPDQLRQHAQEAIDKLNEFSANGVPAEVAAARYKTWASTRN